MKSKKSASVEAVVNLYSSFGDANYIGENINQISHGLQAAYCATRAKADEPTILAALLHDVGHLLGMKDTLPMMGNLGCQNHEGVGADWLRSLSFCEKTCSLVQMHVQAKRYLTCVNPAYFKKLSDASKGTLAYQGGPMTVEEAAVFDKNPLKDTILKMRTWDEAAKIVKWKGPELHSYTDMMMRNITSHRKK